MYFRLIVSMMKKLSLVLFTLALTSAMSLFSQQQSDPALHSITAAELKNHLFFLASDYMNGRYAPGPEYEIAAQYVATQFRAGGVEPAVTGENGDKSYFQGVPFARTRYNEQLQIKVARRGSEKVLNHLQDFKVTMGNLTSLDALEVVYVGYGIEEPGQNWNDLKDLDLKDKVALCLAGAPEKDGNPVFSEEIHAKYTGRRGLYTKLFTNLAGKGVAAIIVVDPADESGELYARMSSSYATERVVYKGATERGSSRSFPVVFTATPAIFDLLMEGSKNNPNRHPDNILLNYKPQALPGQKLSCKVEILGEDMIYSKNVIGIVPGTDPELKDEYIVVGAHLDHVRPQRGQVYNGADDNASGSVGVIEVAEALAMNPTKRSVLFITFTAEEMGLLGSSWFLESGLVPKEQIRFNINLDMIGRTEPKNEDTRAHWVVTDKKYVEKLSEFISGVNEGVTDFPLLFNNDDDSPGGSDHMTFMREGIPAFFFFSGVHADLHQPGDDPEKIDYAKAESLSRLSYLLTQKLGNMEKVPDFL